MSKYVKYALSAAALLTLTACAGGTEEAEGVEGDSSTASSGQTLSAVTDRGELNAGVNDQLPGFGYVDSDGNYTGFDIDIARAVAAAVLGDADAVNFRPLSAQERFTAVQTGEVDVLVRNTTWTASRDTEVGLNFAPVTFYDGQGMMVNADAGVSSLEDLEGMIIGVETGTTTELNLADQMDAIGVSYETQTFDDRDALIAAYQAGSVDAWTTDRSGLVSSFAVLDDPDGHVILEETLSKEPLAPAVLHGDDQWMDVVSWTVFALIQAEEFGITQDNIDDFMDSDDPDVRRLLGIEEDLGGYLGLDSDFAYQAISQVGNYGEIYDRHLGPDTQFDLPRGMNALYEDGGLHYSMPFR
ncbi:polar amino amino acid ABC transporter (PAAT) family, amino acid-binding protein [Alkalibacterium sp. AK22]|uniref:amino acid ABC transporter substrate-binding protein n=1 Tax=Alkalibacterium sp. AK22 TaxID=1229520 RepID=UPI00044E3DB5|nr:amino acid ABC transporter substrate-binding protein [Alkalibacterium sp. AK22]EXJ23709.1 polar amino amino acid ABC transporter (PAAT) family, amino acid-binding protein [Alkalibacterium sp. AK22]